MRDRIRDRLHHALAATAGQDFYGLQEDLWEWSTSLEPERLNWLTNLTAQRYYEDYVLRYDTWDEYLADTDFVEAFHKALVYEYLDETFDNLQRMGLIRAIESDDGGTLYFPTIKGMDLLEGE